MIRPYHTALSARTLPRRSQAVVHSHGSAVMLWPAESSSGRIDAFPQTNVSTRPITACPASWIAVCWGLFSELALRLISSPSALALKARHHVFSKEDRAEVCESAKGH